MNILVTGAAGFIGSAFVRNRLGRHLAPNHDFSEITAKDKIISLDLLTYAGSLENLQPIENDPRHTFVRGNICDPRLIERLILNHKIDLIINFAAESHVDRSISDSSAFIQTNIVGTHVLLEQARIHNIRFVQISTDEVYGSLGDEGKFTEQTPLNPNSPYSASKAAADLLVRSYVKTHKVDALITRCSNNYGPYQHPEKFLPLTIIRILQNQKVPIYGTGLNVRDWLHVEDHCEGIWLAATKGQSGEIYNFGGYGEQNNLQMIERLCQLLQKNPIEHIQFVEDRKGHDWRYSIDASKVQKNLGWHPRWDLTEGLKHMIEWYQTNPNWWKSKIN